MQTLNQRKAGMATWDKVDFRAKEVTEDKEGHCKMMKGVKWVKRISRETGMLKILPGCLGMVAHTCNPSTLGGQGGRITWSQEFKTSLANMVKLPYLLKIQKLAGHGGNACSQSYSGGCNTRIAWTREVEAAVSRDYCTPVWATERDSVSEKNILPDYIIFPIAKIEKYLRFPINRERIYWRVYLQNCGQHKETNKRW